MAPKKKVPQKSPQTKTLHTLDVLTSDGLARKGYRRLKKDEIFREGDLWGYAEEPNAIMDRAKGFIGLPVSSGFGDDFFGVRPVKARGK